MAPLIASTVDRQAVRAQERAVLRALTDFDYKFQLAGIEPSWSSKPLVQRDDSRHPRGMATPIIISVPHQLGRAEARRRIEAGFARIINLLPGRIGARSERWDGDRLIFSVTAMGQTVSGVIHVLDAAVTMEIELPGVLRLLASGLKERLQKVGQLLLTKK